eukprot:CAMPEP_0115546050 /NCGR_PEP_ID=MMETSP0271-20121206/92921_1 /TAXON_ID=71861 /ORGANISM="Scrippsiella trochoidea, Strain CCMP3099" /LENGTH=86 /DNA_ID=CAMNT_0002979419 /DNA_START=151 /DNA_END=411 /DNA_ORIENTATION=-
MGRHGAASGRILRNVVVVASCRVKSLHGAQGLPAFIEPAAYVKLSIHHSCRGAPPRYQHGVSHMPETGSKRSTDRTGCGPPQPPQT